MVQYLGFSTGGVQPGQLPPRSEDTSIPPVAYRTGTAVLVAGTKAVADTTITAASIVQVTAKTLGTVTVASAFLVTLNPGTGFTITASQGTDTSTVMYVALG